MRLLVAIASYGEKNVGFLERLIAEYRSMSFDVHICVLSEAPKNLGSAVEVRVGLPSEDPWSLPFAHRELFAERRNEYDLFLYSEDDTLITENNVRAFLSAMADLPAGFIPGFLRYEIDEQGQRYCSTVHSYFHWKPGSVRLFGGDVYAEFSNQHSAAYLATAEQIGTALASGGFLVTPHNEKYDLLCSAASDIYTQCGFTRVINLSRIDEFLLHHMPNIYIGKLGLQWDLFEPQIRHLLERHRVDARAERDRALIQAEKPVPFVEFSKSYYERPSREFIELCRHALADHEAPVLVVGAGGGELEAVLSDLSNRVTGIPLDSVVGQTSKERGLHVRSPKWEELVHLRQQENRYRVIVLPNVLQHVVDPVGLLGQIATLLYSGGSIIGWTDNFRFLRYRSLARRLRRASWQESRLTPVTAGAVRQWMKAAGIQCRIRYRVPPHERPLLRIARGVAQSLISRQLLFSAVPRGTGD